MLTCIDVKFIFDSARLGLSSSANILQIAEVALRVVFLLFLPCYLHERCIFDVISSLNTKFFQIWSSVTGYSELCVCF